MLVVFWLKTFYTIYMRLPVLFLTFWYLEAPRSLMSYLLSMSNAFLHLLSIPLFLRTFWKPLKNEYRGDLVLFSITVGIILKSILLLTGMAIFILFLLFEIAFYLLFLALPILVIVIPFLPI